MRRLLLGTAGLLLATCWLWLPPLVDAAQEFWRGYRGTGWRYDRKDDGLGGGGEDEIARVYVGKPSEVVLRVETLP